MEKMNNENYLEKVYVKYISEEKRLKEEHDKYIENLHANNTLEEFFEETEQELPVSIEKVSQIFVVILRRQFLQAFISKYSQSSKKKKDNYFNMKVNLSIEMVRDFGIKYVYPTVEDPDTNKKYFILGGSKIEVTDDMPIEVQLRNYMVLMLAETLKSKPDELTPDEYLVQICTEIEDKYNKEERKL